MKKITLSNREQAEKRATEMNPNFAELTNNQTTDGSFFYWTFSEDSIIINYTSGIGSVMGGFTTNFLVKGVAETVGRDGRVPFYHRIVNVE